MGLDYWNVWDKANHLCAIKDLARTMLIPLLVLTFQLLMITSPPSLLKKIYLEHFFFVWAINIAYKRTTYTSRILAFTHCTINNIQHEDNPLNSLRIRLCVKIRFHSLASFRSSIFRCLFEKKDMYHFVRSRSLCHLNYACFNLEVIHPYIMQK